MRENILLIIQNKYIYIPLITWFGIQAFKVLTDLYINKKFNFKKIMAGG